MVIVSWTLENQTRREVVFATLFGSYAFVWFVLTDPVVWSAAAVGFVAFAVGAGPVGTRVDTRIDRIGGVRPLATVVAVVAIASVVAVSLNVSLSAGASFAHGGALGAVAAVAVETIRAEFGSDAGA